MASTNNGDRDKVLATVGSTVVSFMTDHLQAIIHAIGSTPSRTRLYQMGIAKMWDQISVLFEVQGYVDSTWKPFLKGINLQAFLKGK